jgi:hypothetical protein
MQLDDRRKMMKSIQTRYDNEDLAGTKPTIVLANIFHVIAILLLQRTYHSLCLDFNCR